jgi:hypothetical protein
MGKKVRSNPNRIKTKNKKSQVNRKIVNKRVDERIGHVNQFISKEVDREMRERP